MCNNIPMERINTHHVSSDLGEFVTHEIHGALPIREHAVSLAAAEATRQNLEAELDGSWFRIEDGETVWYVTWKLDS